MYSGGGLWVIARVGENSPMIPGIADGNAEGEGAGVP